MGPIAPETSSVTDTGPSLGSSAFGDLLATSSEEAVSAEDLNRSASARLPPRLPHTLQLAVLAACAVGAGVL